MESSPQDQSEFDALIGSEEACRAYLASIRWPAGFVCPRCTQPKAWPTATGVWEGVHCGTQTSVTAGTLFQDTRSPLRVWFQASWYLTGQNYGTSALGLQRVLGLGSYHTAGAWLHRLRRAMVRPGRDRLQGVVQVDETCWGSAQAGKRGRGAAGKTLIQAVQDLVAPGSTVETDGWAGYGGLAQAGYQHQVLRDTVTADLLPQVQLGVALVKRWLLGTHQGGIQVRHLEYYLDE